MWIFCLFLLVGFHGLVFVFSCEFAYSGCCVCIHFTFWVGVVFSFPFGLGVFINFACWVVSFFLLFVCWFGFFLPDLVLTFCVFFFFTDFSVVVNYYLFVFVVLCSSV